ncbi:hypothetical protein VTH06DRAFT_379 [Thermothelomyces fergusii]
MPPKRKRLDRGPSDTGSFRPSPHRPVDMTLGQHDRGFDGGRGGRGGRNPRRGDRRDSFQSQGASSSFSGPDPRSPPPPARPSSSSSSAAPPPPVTAAALAPPAVPATPASLVASPPPVQTFYDYSIVTDDCVGRWAKGGRQEIVDHGVQSREDEDLTEVVMIFQELLHSVTDGRLQGADAGDVVREILGPEISEADRIDGAFDPHVLFLDTVSTFLDVESGPLRPQLRDFMVASGVSPALMRLVLDPPILQHLDLIRDTFVRMGIRQSTNLLYRQANYNLLREESEGFAKLVTELFTISGAEPPTAEVVQTTFNKVMSLIGTFDLHPGRVLDVILDIFAAVLIKQFRFFIKFLRVSSWWPRSQLSLPTDRFVGGLPIWALPEHPGWVATEEEEALLARQRLERDIAFWERARKIKLDAYFELGGRQLAPSGKEEEEEPSLANGASETAPESGIEQAWIRITKTLPPPGNRDAAQMLGFKLRFYTSEARDPEDTLPANLLYLISLLIKVGFISLTDLWNHVWPLDEDMETVKEQKLKELEEKERARRPGGEQNALMMAGALPDDMPPPPSNNSSRRDAAAAAKQDQNNNNSNNKTPSAAEKPEPRGPDDQKVLLLKCLLTIGAIPESLFIIGRHDWILRAFPDLVPLLHRILHHSIDVLYQQARPTSSAPAECPPKPQLDPDQTGVPKGHLRLKTPPVKRALRWPNADQADVEGVSYRFYWDEWADNVPVCRTVDDLFTLSDSLLNLVGVRIGEDAALVTKLARIGSKSLGDDPSPANAERWLGFLKRVLVPALSLGDANASAVDSVWDLLGRYPVRSRFGVYAEWYEGPTSRLEPVQKAFAHTKLLTLSKMKRLSHSNVMQMAKELAKVAYQSPGIVCKVALQQIESYDNLIEAFVECAKYFTDLGHDVLVWSVLSSLAGQERSRTQATSVLLTSKWLQALSRFSGKVFQRYANMDPLPILRYVHAQLLRGNSTDLVVLEELIESMGGIVSSFDFTDAQLRGMTGGEVLRRQTLASLGDRRDVSGPSARRLMRALSQSNLAGQLLINIAQYRQNAIYKITDDKAVIKYLSALVDGSHKVLSRYLDLLLSNLDPDTFNRLVPDLVQLMRDYGLDANLAFMIRRNTIRWDAKALPPARESPPQAARPAATDANGDVIMATAAAADGTPADPNNIINNNNTTEATKDGAGDDRSVSRTPSRLPESLSDALAPLIEEIPKLLPRQSWKYISPACYVFFWSLQLGNLVWPQDSYEAANKRLKAQAAELTTDRSDTRGSAETKKRKREEIMDQQQRLLQETKDGIERFQKTKLHIGRQTSGWFPAGVAHADATSDALLEECILPRLQISPVDADYCFRLIKFLHEFPKSNFRLMSLYNRLFNHNRLRALIFTCTVREAEHLARFLKFILGDLSKWHGNRSAYEKEALGLKELQGTRAREYIGFATAFDADGKPTEFVEHDAFKELLFRWHKELNSALRTCLNGTEWMHIRNAISILKGVIDYFPAINFMAEKFLEQLNAIKDRESASSNAPESAQGHRVDLSVTAQTTYSELAKRKSRWVLVQAFRPGAKSESRDEKGPAPPADAPLRGSAAPPKPGPGRPQQQSSEVEDGEVDESKAGQAAPGGNATSGLPRPPPPPPTREAPRETNPPAPKTNASAANPPGRPSTPKPAPAPQSGPRQEPPREPPRFSTLPPGGPGLPNRPEPPARHDPSGPRFGQPRPDRRDLPTREARDYRDNREPRDQHQRDPRESQGARDGRDYRTPEGPRPERPPRDIPSSDRRGGPDPGPRDSNRDPSRDAGRVPDRGRAELPSRRHDHASAADRDGRPDSRPPPRERGAPHGSSRSDSRPGRESAVSTPPATASQGAPQAPPINPERARIIEGERPEMLNPARAALINDTREPPSGRHSPREQPRERPPRADSPRRSDRPPANPPSLPDNGRDDRHGRRRHSPGPDIPRDSRVDAAGPPSRAERNVEREDRNAGPRDSYASQTRPDHDHGRLSQQDPNYGRLNPIQSVVDLPPGPPSGPRGRGGRNMARPPSVSGPPPMRPDNRFPPLEAIRPPTPPDRHPPTGPSSSRPRRGPYDNGGGGGGGGIGSPTSAGAPAGAGVHPDRMRQISQTSPAAPPPPPPASGPPGPPGPSGIHPDRLNQIAVTQSPGPAMHSRAPMHTPDRPPMSTPGSGSRPAPSGPSADFSSTPSGPAAAHDRMRPGGRQLRGIQNTLDKASADNARGSGPRPSRSRPSLAGSDAQILVGASPVSTPVHERPPESFRDSSRREPSDRPPRGGPEPIQMNDARGGRETNNNSSSSSGSGSRALPNGDDYGSSRSEHDRSRREHHRSERSSRPSGRSSRDRTPDREREPKDSREYRDRRSSNVPGGGSSRDDRDSRRSMRESAGGGREAIPGGGRDLVPPRESSSHRSHRGEPGPRGEGSSGGGRGGEDYGRSASSRGGGPPRDSRSLRPGDERGDPRGGEDRTRKRRSEGIEMGSGSHQDKRQRR